MSHRSFATLTLLSKVEHLPSPNKFVSAGLEAWLVTNISFSKMSCRKFSFSAIAEIQADIVITSAGLFAGLSGGLVLASHHASTQVVRDLEQYPLLAAALMATLDEMEVHGLPDRVHNSAQELAVLIAEQLSGFEFVRDMRVSGMTIGIECDVNSVDVVAAAAANGLRVEAAGDTAILMQPPLLISGEDRQLLLKRLNETMEAIERETAELTL